MPHFPVATHLDDQDAHPNLSDGSFFLSSCPGFMGPFVAALFSPPPAWFRERSHCTYYAFLFIDFSFLFLLIDLQLAPLRTQAPWEQDFHHLADCCVPIPSTGPGSWREGQGQTHRGTQLGDTSLAKQNESGESLGAQPKEPSGGYDVSMWWLQLGEPGFGDCLRATSRRTYFKHETCFKRRRQCLQENTSDLGVL